jgi:pilus assembly protein Flp/PilA
VDAIRTMLRRLRASEGGATAIEYGLIAALIALACIQGMIVLGGGNDGMWGKVGTRVSEAMAPQ